MKRNLLILLCACSLLISCQQQEQFATIDFGTAEFEEPFRGPLASQPSWLVATLDWPILRILKSDTVVLSKTIEIGFNEDAVRSNASARIFIVDENGNTSKKYQISCNNTPMGKDGYDLKATSEPQQLELVVKVDPSIGDTTVRGYISIMGNEIDEVNSIPLTEEGAQNVAQWSFTHEIGWPLMIWTIWIFLLILLIILIVYLLKYLVIGIASLGNSSAIAGAATSVSTKGSITKPTQKYPNNRKNKKIDDVKKDNQDILKSYIWLQEKGDQNQLLNSFKLSNPEKLHEENLQSYIYWEETDYFKALVFKWRLHRFIKSHYHKYFRLRFKLEPLIDPGLPYIWIGTSCKNHLRELAIIKLPASEKNLKNCLYFHNTKLGNKRAQKLLNQINTYINEHYQ